MSLCFRLKTLALWIFAACLEVLAFLFFYAAPHAAWPIAGEAAALILGALAAVLFVSAPFIADLD